MNKLFAFALAAGIGVGSLATSATAMPALNVGSPDQAAGLTLVAGGCGYGEHRGPYGGCRLNNGPRGRLRAAISGAPRGCPPGLVRGPRGFCHR